MVDPLPPDFPLADRFEVVRVLGRGGFSIVYEAKDLLRGDKAVLKEFTPPDAQRRANEVIELGTHAPALRHAFLEEARTLGRLNVPGVLPVRAAFTDHGTACVVTDAVPNARTLDALLREQGPLDADGVLDLAYQLMETLEGVHSRGLLHRDLKPSNVLVGPDGRTYLLDFGAAREWTIDATEAHTVLFTPGYAPPEQRVLVARRGPETDVYGLCATLYAAFTARAPTDAAARAVGESLVPLSELRPDLDEGIVAAIEVGLSLRMADRPATVAELRRLLGDGPDRQELDTLEALDSLLVRSQRFAFDRRACPACGGILEEARPLAKGRCPVCRFGRIKAQKLDDRLCPTCRRGALRIQTPNSLRCDECIAVFEALPDGRFRERLSGRALYRAEWARLAAGLEATGGNASCDGCDAEYHQDGRCLTLLNAPDDPHGFAAAYQGRPIPRELLRWLAVGKRNSNPGLVCDRCDTEFDHTGRLLTLVGSSNRRLDRLSGDTRSLDSWHRVAEGLPEAGRHAEIEDRIVRSLAVAYRRGEIGFGNLLWRGPAVYRGRSTTLAVSSDALRIGRGLRVRHIRLVDLRGIRAEGDRLLAEGSDGALEIQIEPVELVAHLRSGDRAVLMTVNDLVARLAWTGLAERYRTS